MDSAGDEVEGRAAFHLNRRARVMGQHKRGNVIGWVFSPPAFPVRVTPGSASWCEHVSAKNPSANIFEAPRGELVINPGGAALGAEDGLLEGARGEKPLMQIGPAHAKRIVKILIRAASESVNRDAEAVNSNACHFHTLLSGDDRLSAPFWCEMKALIEP